MQKAYLHLTKYMLNKGFSIRVADLYDGMAIVKHSTSYKEIKEAIESVDETILTIYNQADEIVGTAIVILDYGQEPDETVSDFSMDEIMTEWEEEYFS